MPLSVNKLLICGFVCGTLCSTITRLHRISGGPLPFKGPKRREGPSVWYPAVPMVINIALLIANRKDLCIVNPAVFIMIFGLVFAKLDVKMLLYKYANGDMPFFDSCFIWLLFLHLNTYYKYIDPSTSLWICFGVMIVEAIRYFSYAILDIRDAQDVYVFSLKYPVGHPKMKTEIKGVYFVNDSSRWMKTIGTNCKPSSTNGKTK